MRENGYYWVFHTKVWEVAEWFIDHWECIGMDRSYQDSDFKKIGRMVERKENRVTLRRNDTVS